MNPPAFLADPRLPQLTQASDTRLMRDMFEKYLRPRSQQGYHIQDCSLSRLRYRQATRCVMQYTLRLVAPGTNPERKQWVTGVMYARDQAKRTWKSLHQVDVRQRYPEAGLAFEPVAFIPELKMLLQVFPYDRRLPTLRQLVSEPPLSLERLLLSRFGPGTWHLKTCKVEPVRYRAGLGAVLKYTVQAQHATTYESQERRFYVKVYRESEGERSYEVLKSLQAKTKSANAGFGVVTPLAYLSDLHALLLEEVPGATLRQILLKGPNPLALVNQVANALAAFHQDDGSVTRRHSRADELADLRRVGTLLRGVCPHLRTEIDAITNAVATGLKEAPCKPTHRDLKPEHILFTGDRPVLVDLDLFAGADPVLDSANLLARMTGLAICFPSCQDRIQISAQAFVEAYFARVPRAWRRRFPLRYAAASLEVAASMFRNQEPGWSEKIPVLVQKAGDFLAGKAW